MKRTVLLVVSIVMAVALAINGTIAYLTDTDSDVNVMTLGNVQIEQIEQERDDAGVVNTPFTQDKPLYPAYYEDGETDLDKITGELDKYVSVENTGASDAYVRTVFAFEGTEIGDIIHLIKNETEWDWETLDTPITIGGVDYTILVATYPEVLAAGDTTPYSLMNLYMDKKAGNDDVAAYGNTYDVLVQSQAVQTENMPEDPSEALNAAFGEVEDNVADWFDGVSPVSYVSDISELQEALAKGGTVKLTDDITVTEEDLQEIVGRDDGMTTVFNVAGKSVTLDLNGKNINVEGNTDAVFFATDGKLDIVGAGDIITDCECYMVWARGDEGTDVEVNIYGSNFVAEHDPSDSAECAVLLYADATNYGDGTTPPHSHINVYGGTYSNAIVTGQSVLNVKNHGAGEITLYGGSFKNFDPATDVSADDKKWVKPAAGYNTEKIGDWYAVGEGEVPVVEVNDQATLKAALQAGKDVELQADEYTFPSSNIPAGTTITCAPGTVFNGNSSLNIKGSTVEGATFSNEGGNTVGGTINGTFKDCVFTGDNALRSCYAGETVVFENCVFDGDLYGVHFDSGSNDVIFKDCTFSGFNTFGSALTKLTLDGCTFVSNGKSDYNGVNLWGDSDLIDCTFIFDGSCGYEWVDACYNNKTLNFTNCVVNDGTTTMPLDRSMVGDYGSNNTINFY